MYQHHTILPGGLRNTAEADKVVGFDVQVRIGFPRGVPLSLIEGFEIDIDNGSAAVHFASSEVTFILRGRPYRPADMVDIVTERWEMGEIADLAVTLPGGLNPGPHQITVTQFLRVGPTPEPARTVGTRTVHLTPPPTASASAPPTPPAHTVAMKGSTR